LEKRFLTIPLIVTIAMLALAAFIMPVMANYAFDGWAPTTRTDGTINGTVFVDSVGWNGQTTLSGSFNVPGGTVRSAYLYTGIWGGNPDNTGWVNVTFNGNYTANGLGPIHLRGNLDTNPNVWCTGYGRGEDPYVNICNTILVLNDTANDLVVKDIDVGTPRPKNDFTVKATVKNDGSNSVGHFNVSLFVNSSFYAKNTSISSLGAGASTTVSFYPVNLPKGCHEFRVFADSDSEISEDIETNNNMTVNGEVGYVIKVKSNSDFDTLVTESNNGLLGYSGVKFHNLSNGTVENSTVQNNTRYGIEVGEVPLGSDDPNNVTITNNTIKENLYGIELIGFNCTVDKNTIQNNTAFGVYLLANDTKITYNVIQNNSDYSVKLYNSYNNYIYENEFIGKNIVNPGHQAWDNRTSNYWNTTEIGNYWTDWDDNSDAPGNYSIDGGTNKDYEPHHSATMHW